MNIRAKIFGTAPSADPILRAKQPRGAKGDDLHSVAVPREEGRRSNSRGADRHRLSEQAVRITHKGRRRTAELINLSGGGAMVSAAGKLKLWDMVELHLGEHGTVECAVCWLRDDRVGLEFAHETRLDCPVDEQAALLRDVISRSFSATPAVESRKANPEPEQQPQPSADSDEDLRNAKRHPLIWSGMLHHDYQSTPVRLRNISATGAMIETTESVRVGAEPLLELGDSVSLSATVEWAIGDQVGVRFHSPFDMTLLGRCRTHEAPARWTRPTYLDKNKADAACDLRWQRLSVGELKDELDGFLKR